MEKWYDQLSYDHELLPVWLRVREDRPVSNAIERDLGVRHESPQILMVYERVRSRTSRMRSRPVFMTDKTDHLLDDLFSLDDGDPPPAVDTETLQVFHNYLSENLSFPVQAVYSEPEGDESDREISVRIMELLDLDQHPILGPYLGLMCVTNLDDDETMTVPLSRIVRVKNEEQRPYIDAYSFWFWKYR